MEVVEQKCAILGLLKQTSASRHGASECATLMSEDVRACELGAQLTGRNVDEGTRPTALAMHRCREERLSRSCLPDEHDGCAGGGKLTNPMEYLGHRRRDRDHSCKDGRLDH